jgi:hypothetical protein
MYACPELRKVLYRIKSLSLAVTGMERGIDVVIHVPVTMVDQTSMS